VIGRLHARWRLLRSFFSRSEWMARLLGLRVFPEDGVPGLLMIQIDGFSHQELQRALKRKEMPFLARLLKREHYEVRRLYSGLPSNTPAMQGELFYGVPCAVPAFGFFNHRCNRLCRMSESESAREVEASLEKQGEALLKGGSSYSNIYTGGAGEPRWCFASMGWGTSTKAPGPALLVLLALLNAYSFARAGAVALLELWIALWDAIQGIRRGEGPHQELAFIPARVATEIILREWITAAVRMDVARGMPVIHANFVGYDEQAHRRGPDSAFAHWVLRGIDDAVKRIWTAAKKSRRRDYEIWIYSDHGQVHSTPYHKTAGKGLRERVWELWHEEQAIPRKRKGEEKGFESLRVRLLGGKKLQKLLPVREPKPPPPDPGAHPIVADLGPVALIYLGPGADAARRAALGERLAREGGVPLVIEAGSAPLRCWTAEGEFFLPRDADAILGDHPFREQVLGDLERVIRHEHAGDLLAFGWRKGIPRTVTFAWENGSHGGLSPEETSAFVALPRYLERELLGPGILRPADLHNAGLVLQGRRSPDTVPPGLRPSPPSQIRVMTYNVHSCIGMDQRHDPRRIARVIAHYHPDVVALQELETDLPRSRGAQQARQIAELLRFEYHFHAVREADDGQFGNAILSRYPMRLLRAGGLPSLGGRRGSETRGALWAEIDIDGMTVQILNTHLGLWPRERLSQVRALLGPRWLGGRNRGVPLILCGDLNCGPRSAAYRELRRSLADCQLQLRHHRPGNTWFTRFPVARLDHILVSEALAARQIHIPSFHLAKMASDHFPLVADIALRAEDAPPSPAVSAAAPQGGRHVA
jgi:endonuclease/exonuclease/phosphatase family metal-dependent hydrolase